MKKIGKGDIRRDLKLKLMVVLGRNTKARLNFGSVKFRHNPPLSYTYLFSTLTTKQLAHISATFDNYKLISCQGDEDAEDIIFDAGVDQISKDLLLASTNNLFGCSKIFVG